jgi:hypothetical protein
VSDRGFDLQREVLGSLQSAFVARLAPDERAAVEAATGELGNKPEAVRLGWLRMRTKEPWTKQRYALTVRRALLKLQEMVAAEKTRGGHGSTE